MGINFNNLDSGSYVGFIKSQLGELEKDHAAVFLNQKVDFKDTIASHRVDILGQSTDPGEKWIEIDLSDQKLYRPPKALK